MQPYLKAYAKVYPNLVKHDPRYPTPEYLQARTLSETSRRKGKWTRSRAGSQLIVKVLLDESDQRPVWIQAWGGPNTIARALKTIEEQHPRRWPRSRRRSASFSSGSRTTPTRSYIRPHWGKYGIPTIISDQFIAIFYHWKKYLPADKQAYLAGSWMKANILENHGPLCALYKAHAKGDKGFDEGDFRSEGDSPAFLHTIPTGLRSMESPGLGRLGRAFCEGPRQHLARSGGEPGYQYPEGRWYTNSAWGRQRLKKEIPNDAA